MWTSPLSYSFIELNGLFPSTSTHKTETSRGLNTVGRWILLVGCHPILPSVCLLSLAGLRLCRLQWSVLTPGLFPVLLQRWAPLAGLLSVRCFPLWNGLRRPLVNAVTGLTALAWGVTFIKTGAMGKLKVLSFTNGRLKKTLHYCGLLTKKQLSHKRWIKSIVFKHPLQKMWIPPPCPQFSLYPLQLVWSARHLNRLAY